MRIRWIGSLVVSLAAVQGCGDSGTTTARGGDGGPGTGCGKDTDCKGDRICVAGECVSPSADSGSGSTGGSSSGGTGGRSTGTGGASTAGTGGRSTGGTAGAGGGAVAGADSGASGGSGNGGSGTAGGSNGGAGGRGAGGAGPGPQCTPQDTSACPPTFPFGPCCTSNDTCGIMYPPFGCIPTGGNFDAGTGTGGSPTGGGLVNAACKTCRASQCSTEAAACNANAACAALSTCIDNASPFNILNCLTGVTTQARTLYNALSSCASTSCTSAPCPNINI
jgi:hypothetical protein